MEFSPYHLKRRHPTERASQQITARPLRGGEQALHLTSCPGGTTRLQINTRACLVSKTSHIDHAGESVSLETATRRSPALLTRKGEGFRVVSHLMHRALRGLAAHQAVEVVANTAVAEPLDVDVGIAGGGEFAVEAKELSAPWKPHQDGVS